MKDETSFRYVQTEIWTQMVETCSQPRYELDHRYMHREISYMCVCVCVCVLVCLRTCVRAWRAAMSWLRRTFSFDKQSFKYALNIRSGLVPQRNTPDSVLSKLSTACQNPVYINWPLAEQIMHFTDAPRKQVLTAQTPILGDGSVIVGSFTRPAAIRRHGHRERLGSLFCPGDLDRYRR